MFLFIGFFLWFWDMNCLISIHLMFLFIPAGPIHYKSSISDFNTSNVFIYHVLISSVRSFYSNFNTSNVFIYRCCVTAIIRLNRISIHLMFLFIHADSYGADRKRHISIHLMFLFIRH